MDSISLLLVEDDSVDARALQRRLAASELSTFHVEHVTHVDAALERLEHSPVDALVLALADGGGLSVVRRLTTRFPELPVVILTDAPDAELGSRALSVGAQDCLAKGEQASVERAVRDAIDRKRAELERRRSEERPLEVRRPESLGLTAGVAAHDLNNILTVILGQVGLCRAEVEPGTTLAEGLERIESASRRAGELCRQLLAGTGRGEPAVGPLDLSALVEDVTQMMRPTVPTEVELATDLLGEPPSIVGSDAQVRQVVMNLIVNAAEAIEGAGRITVSTRTCEGTQAAPDSMIVPVEPGTHVVVEVADTGCGMTPEARAEMFTPFFSTKERGHGLGLAAVSGVVRSHGAGLDVASRPGRGTAVRVWFPADAARLEGAVEPSGADTGAGLAGTILVIEDDPEVRFVARAALERHGARVLLAADGAAGLEQLDAHASEVALVLLDLTLPGVGSEQVIARLSERRPELPVVTMSGYGSDESAAHRGATGFAGFLSKPFGSEQLLAACRRALESR